MTSKNSHFENIIPIKQIEVFYNTCLLKKSMQYYDNKIIVKANFKTASSKILKLNIVETFFYFKLTTL